MFFTKNGAGQNERRKCIFELHLVAIHELHNAIFDNIYRFCITPLCTEPYPLA